MAGATLVDEPAVPVDRGSQRREVALVGGLGPWRGHAGGRVQAPERPHAVDARILAVDEAFPADPLQVREGQVGPRLHVLGDPVAVVGRGIRAERFAIRGDHADAAVVEGHPAGLVNHPGVVGLVPEEVAEHEVPRSGRRS